MIVSIILSAAPRTAPGHPRVLYLDIDGHRLADGNFDPGCSSYRSSLLLPYVREAWLHIGNLKNPEQQRDDVPDQLVICPMERARA